MNTNILFVIPPVLPYQELEQCGKVNYSTYIPTSLPLGVLSMASYLEKHCSVSIKIVDLNIELRKANRQNCSFNHILQNILSTLYNNYKPDIVAISALFNSTFSYINIISKLAKELFNDCIVITGGGLPTNLYKEVLESAPCIDAVSYGEGEIPIVELVSSLNKKEYLKSSPHWITHEKVSPDFKPVPKFIFELDQLSPINYDLIDLEAYQENNRYHGENKSARVVSLMTSRGCPFNCCFCASHSVHGKKIRLMSAERVLEDIEILIDKYKIDTFLIEDDHFLINKERALKILKALEGRNINIEFPNGLAVYAIDEAIAFALKRAGVKMATLAIESGSERVLREIIHKPLTLPKVIEVVKILRNVDIYIRAFFIVGFPGETEEDRKKSVEFIRKAGFNWVAIMIASPIAGSELYSICKENNYLISDSIEDFHYGKGNIKTEHINPEEIEEVRYLMNLDLNFVNNYDLKNGHYEMALIGFNDVIKRVPNHAFAYYCIHKCYEKLEKEELSKEHLNKFNEIIEKDMKWKSYAERFNLI